MNSNSNKMINSSPRNTDTLYFKAFQLIHNLKRKHKITGEEFLLLKNDLKKSNSILKRKIYSLNRSFGREGSNNLEKIVLENLEEVFFQIRFLNSVTENFCRKSSSKKEKRESSPISKNLLRRKMFIQKEEIKDQHKEFKIILKKII